MKTKDLTFLEAVRALKEGRCEGIKRGDFGIPNFSGSAIFHHSQDHTGIEIGALDTEHLLAIDWQLINPRTEKETVEEKRWMWEDGEIAHSVKYRPSKGEPGQWITVKYEREVPEPETVEFEGITYANGVIQIVDHIVYPESGKRVRCIVED